MKRSIELAALLGLTLALCVATSCGGGRTAVVGFGNGGNRIIEESEVLEELAEVLAENESLPPITDETLRQVFEAILQNARSGDPQAALIVLRVAEQQRAAADS